MKKNAKISFITEDGVSIVGNYLSVDGASRATLLLHMMPAAKESFESLAEELSQNGFSVLAIDLRGHGESVRSSFGTLDYRRFEDSDHQKSRFDVDAALKFLESKGFFKDTIFLVGASIGANLSLEALARFKEIKKAVLLSPGLDYRGVRADKAVSEVGGAKKVLLIAAEGDSYSADSVQRLFFALGAEKAEMLIYQGNEHGTDMWKTHPELISKIRIFLAE